MGLAAVHGIVRQMRGRLWARSEPGKGASFRVYLPLAQAKPAARQGPATILLIERNDGLRTVVTNILKKRGYRVLAAYAAEDALEMAKTGGPPDLIVAEHEVQPQLQTHARVAALSKPFDLQTLLAKVRDSVPA